ncbi:MAG TPA: mechanosensitive ion channel domain-containing protein [Azospira sp.]|nr:mechanosensitive ion channel domain-containing protein [Azospira sp.]
MEHLPALLLDLWDDLQNPQMLWQAGVLLACLGIAWFGARGLRTRIQATPERWHAGRSGVNRLLFPAIALGLVVVLRPVLKPFMHVNLLSLAIPLLLSLGGIRLVVYILRKAFAPSGWLAASERLIAALMWATVALHIVGLDDLVIDALEQVKFAVGRQRLDLWIVLHGLVTVFITLLGALWLAGVAEARLMAADKLDSSVRVVMARVVKALLTLVAVLMSLSLVGIDITTLSVFGGALGVGLGFGLQKIASNYVSGFIILLDRSIRLGNVISIDAATSGVVTQITTRYTVLRALTGTEYIIPNEYFVANIVQSQSYTDTRVFLKTSVQVGYSSDVEKAMELLVEAARSHARVLPDSPPRAYLTGFADSGINLEVGFWIADPEEGSGALRSDINLAIWRSFKEHGIEIPFPQREVRILGDAPGAAPVAAPATPSAA